MNEMTKNSVLTNIFQNGHIRYIYRDYEAQGLNSCFECTLFVLNEIDRLTQSSFDLLKFYKYIIV